MTPQQQQMLLQMLMSRGTAGMQQPGMGAPVGGAPPGIAPGQPMMAPGMMQPGMMPGATMANNPLMNPAAGQMNPAMNQQLMQYMLALRGAQQPTMAQMLSPQGGNTWGLGL